MTTQKKASAADEKTLAVKWALERIGDGTGSLVEDVRYSGDEPHSVEIQDRKVELSQALITARQHMKISVERVAKAYLAWIAAIHGSGTSISWRELPLRDKLRVLLVTWLPEGTFAWQRRDAEIIRAMPRTALTRWPPA